MGGANSGVGFAHVGTTMKLIFIVFVYFLLSLEFLCTLLLRLFKH
jgi:hypothetical protein